MSKALFENLLIRTAVVMRPDIGFIYACDPKKEEMEIPHAITFRYMDGIFEKGECNYDAHSATVIGLPEPGIVDISASGYYSANTKKGLITKDVFVDSQPPPIKSRNGGIRSVSEIEGKAYAVGIRGMVYRLDELTLWTRIDEGLPDNFNVQSIHGFGASDIYSVGRHGEMWHYNGKKWNKVELPTSRNLTSVKCAGNGVVYIAGYSAILIQGREDKWEVINHEETEEDIWDLEWFMNNLYVSTMTGVFCLKDNKLEATHFGEDSPESCYQLSAAKDVMWSNGEYDLMSFDGYHWKRIV